jgi:hypothetical protein
LSSKLFPSAASAPPASPPPNLVDVERQELLGFADQSPSGFRRSTRPATPLESAIAGFRSVRCLSLWSMKLDAKDARPADTMEPGPAGPSAPRGGSKLARLIALLERDHGATIAELIAATGWLAHTTRAALTGLRKRGFAVAIDQADKAKRIIPPYALADANGACERSASRSLPR